MRSLRKLCGQLIIERKWGWGKQSHRGKPSERKLVFNIQGKQGSWSWGKSMIKERAKGYLKYWRLQIRSHWSKVKFIRFTYHKLAFVYHSPKSCAWKRGSTQSEHQASSGLPPCSACLYLTAVCRVHASTSDLCEVPWWILIFQNSESGKGYRWHQDDRLELQMSWSNRNSWSWWLGLSTGSRYWLPYKSNCSLRPITMKSGRVEYWRTGSGSKYQQGQFLADLRALS